MVKGIEQHDKEAVASYINDMLKGMAELATASGCDDLGKALAHFSQTCPLLPGFNGGATRNDPPVEHRPPS